MKKKKCLASLIMLYTLLSLTTACMDNERMSYYSEQANYLTATGTVSYLKYSENNDTLYIGVDDLTPAMDDNCFKIVGENLRIAQKCGIDETLQIGTVVEFITAPKYFGDGYVMPVVSITVGDTVILDFETGYTNLLVWLQQNSSLAVPQ